MPDTQPNPVATPCLETENLEKYAGHEIPDPWDDPHQTDWPDNPPVKDS